MTHKTEKRINTEPPEALDPFGGGCPQCGLNHGYLNVGRAHWFVCHTHKTKWCRGDNLMSSWRYESEREWASNHARLKSYSDVEPIYAAEVPTPRGELPVHLLRALESILEAYMEDEENDYRTCLPDQREKHIFRSFATLYGWLNGIRRPVELFEMWMRDADVPAEEVSR